MFHYLQFIICNLLLTIDNFQFIIWLENTWIDSFMIEFTIHVGNCLQLTIYYLHYSLKLSIYTNLFRQLMIWFLMIQFTIYILDYLQFFFYNWKFPIWYFIWKQMNWFLMIQFTIYVLDYLQFTIYNSKFPIWYFIWKQMNWFLMIQFTIYV